MKKLNLLKGLLIVFSIQLASLTPLAGQEGVNGDYYQESEDTSVVSNDSWWFDFAPKKKEEKENLFKPLKKYQRNISNIPIDSLTELITYTSIDRLGDECKFCGVDSLYSRTKFFLLREFGNGKKFNKKAVFIIEDVQNEKIFLKVRRPLIVEYNKNSKRQIGYYEFILKIWVVDSAYKYKFTEFIHLEPKLGSSPKNFSRIYLESYIYAKRKVRHADSILLGVDTDINKFIENFKLGLKDPISIILNNEGFR
jgi:hypothetical protein